MYHQYNTTFVFSNSTTLYTMPRRPGFTGSRYSVKKRRTGGGKSFKKKILNEVTGGYQRLSMCHFT